MLINNKDITIGKKIGEGVMGTVYLATDKNNKKYALKIEHILKKDIYSDKNNIYDIKTSSKSQLWRENEFAKTLGDKYPDQFLKLYDYKIINNCDHKQKIPNNFNIFGPKKKQKLLELAQSKYCIMRLYSIVDTTLQKIKLNIKQRYSMMVQVSYIVYLMQTHGYLHNDFHFGNIGVKKTDKKYINININTNTNTNTNTLDKKIPTFGYIYCAIDYGLVLNKKYILSNEENKKFNRKNDLHVLLNSMYNDDKLINYWIKLINNKKIVYDYDSDMKLFNKTNEKKILEKITDNVEIQFELFSVIFPTAFQKLLLKQYTPKKPFDVVMYIPLEQIIHFVSIIDNPKKCIEYFIQEFNKK